MDESHQSSGAVLPEATSPEPLSELLLRVRQRDEQAARELVEHLHPLVSRIVHANLPRRYDAEDLMQDVFLKTFSRLDQFRGGVPFEHWVARTALTTCLDRLRRQRVRPELRWADLDADEQAMLETIDNEAKPADADAPSVLALVEKLLEQLPPADAWLLRQIELEEKSIEQVCAETGWNRGVTRVRLFRARKRLQAQMCQLEKSK
jgi:RNA polymerase sigma-70 factor (ECF subfamily)